MALAGDHAKVEETTNWRAIAAFSYIVSLLVIAVFLLLYFPPHFDLRLGTIVSVVFVAVFLVAMERPVNTSATMVAPLTAISAASAIVFGSWVIVLYIAAWLAVRWHISTGESRWKNLLKLETLGQVAIAINVSYTYLGLWHVAGTLVDRSPAFAHNLLTFFAVVAVALGGQTANNMFAYPWYLIKGHPFSIRQLFRTGLIASIYAYLLLATYRFGGIIATAIFYTVVAQIRVVQDVLGVTAQLHKLERANDQARGLVKDMIRLTDASNVEFASEVQNIAQMLGRRLGMSKKDLENLALAAELHELGKARLPARIRYTNQLTPKEQAQKQTYSRWGALMVRAADAILPSQIADIIEFHTEHYDGSGYPRGLKAEDIPQASRIIAVSRDYVRYLTGYDGAGILDKEKALSLLREGSGTLYDPVVVKLLFDLVS